MLVSMGITESYLIINDRNTVCVVYEVHANRNKLYFMKVGDSIIPINEAELERGYNKFHNVFYEKSINDTVKSLKFPEDFKIGSHEGEDGGVEWTYAKGCEVIISVFGGGEGTYGDGVNTFSIR